MSKYSEDFVKQTKKGHVSYFVSLVVDEFTSYITTKKIVTKI